jgi:hypothetical protein
MVRQQFSDAPTMIGGGRCHRRRPLKPFVPTNQSRQSQTLVLSAEVVDCADQIHARLQRFTLFGKRPTAPRQTRQALAKRRIQSLDEGRVDDALALCTRNYPVNVASLALHDTPLNAAYTPLLILFNHLRNQDSRPGPQGRSPGCIRRHRLAKHLADGADVSFQAIRTKQQAQRQSRCTGADLFNQRRDQRAIAAIGNRPTQPQPGADHHGQGHPDDAALLLDAQFIHLYLAEVARRGNQSFMHSLAMPASALLPIGDGALIYGKGGDNGLPRAAVRQQGDHLGEALIGVAQPVKRRALGCGKGLLANRAFEAVLLLRMNRDVAFFQSASSRASQIRTKYRQWVQSRQSFRSGIQKGLSLDPRSIQNATPPRLTGALPVIAQAAKNGLNGVAEAAIRRASARPWNF